jgi:hypothetical protein
MGSEAGPYGPRSEHEHLDEDISEPEVCELCGMLITAGRERYGLVPDPIAGYPVQLRWDGWRLAVACSKEHMTELIRRGEQAAE